MKGPTWVAREVRRTATRSPSAMTSSMVMLASARPAETRSMAAMSSAFPAPVEPHVWGVKWSLRSSSTDSARPSRKISWTNRRASALFSSKLIPIPRGSISTPASSRLQPKQPAEGLDDAVPRARATVGEPFLETRVLVEAEGAIRGQGGWIVRADIEDHVVAFAQELGGHRAGRGLGVAAALVRRHGHDVADDAHAPLAADRVRARGGDQPSTHTQAVIDALGDGLGREPCSETEVVHPVQLADARGGEALDRAGIRPEAVSVDRQAHHRRTRFDAVQERDCGEEIGQRADVRAPGPDDVAQERLDPVRIPGDVDRLRGGAALLHR